MTDALEKQVQAILANYQKTQDGSSPRWLLALSGGVDSVFLLHMLEFFREHQQLEWKAVHVNHGLRGDEAYADAQFCASLCHTRNITLSIRHTDVLRRMRETHAGLEEAARDARYELLREEAEAFGATAILLAHQQEDQAETVLLHLLRGAGLAGLTGMKERTPFGENRSSQPIYLLRPLLHISKAEMQTWLTERNFTWREDGSNTDLSIARNRVRHQIMPLLAESLQVNPTLALSRCAALLQQDDSFLKDTAESAFAAMAREENGQLVVDTEAFAAMHPAIGSRVMRLLWEAKTGDGCGLESQHVKAMMSLVWDMRNRKPGKSARKTVALPMKITAVCTVHALWLEKKADTIVRKPTIAIKMCGPGKYPIHLPEAGIFGTIEITCCTDIRQAVGTAKETDLTQYFDAERLVADLASPELGTNMLIRFRRTGDILFAKGAPGSKKLKDWMIDAHIPSPERDNQLLITKGKDIVWIVGRRTGERYRLTEKTNEIWAITWKQVNNVEESDEVEGSDPKRSVNGKDKGASCAYIE